MRNYAENTLDIINEIDEEDISYQDRGISWKVSLGHANASFMLKEYDKSSDRSIAVWKEAEKYNLLLNINNLINVSILIKTNIINSIWII